MARTFRVVIIDDDPDLRKLVKLTLEFTAAWEVDTAADGEQGIAKVKDFRPDAVVVDYMMPGMDGYEVCRRLKDDDDTAHIPVVFLTARKELDAARIEETGAAGVIVKPFEPDELAAELRRLVGKEGDV